MLEHWLIELVGHVSGLSDAQLKQIEKSLPATKALVDSIEHGRSLNRIMANPIGILIQEPGPSDSEIRYFLRSSGMSLTF